MTGQYSILYTPITYEERKAQHDQAIENKKQQNLDFLLATGAFFGALAAFIGSLCLIVAIYSSKTYNFPHDAKVAINYGCNGAPTLFIKTIPDLIDPSLVDTITQTDPPASGDPLGVFGGSSISFTASNALLSNQGIGALYQAGAWLSFLGGLLMMGMLTGMYIHNYAKPKQKSVPGNMSEHVATINEK